MSSFFKEAHTKTPKKSLTCISGPFSSSLDASKRGRGDSVLTVMMLVDLISLRFLSSLTPSLNLELGPGLGGGTQQKIICIFTRLAETPRERQKWKRGGTYLVF